MLINNYFSANSNSQKQTSLQQYKSPVQSQVIKARGETPGGVKLGKQEVTVLSEQIKK